MVTFTQHVAGTRKIEFDVSGKKVTRRMPQQFAGTVDDYIRAIAYGLSIEEASGELKADNGSKISSKITPQDIAASLTIAPGTVLIDDSVPLVP
jgi:hypothetical protein